MSWSQVQYDIVMGFPMTQSKMDPVGTTWSNPARSWQLATALFAISTLLSEVPKADDLGNYEPDEALMHKNTQSAILKTMAITCLIESLSLSDTARGKYNTILYSIDFFETCLRAPDRQFCHLFWYINFSQSTAIIMLTISPELAEIHSTNWLLYLQIIWSSFLVEESRSAT